MFRPAHLMAVLLLASPAAVAQPDPNAPPPMQPPPQQQQPRPPRMTFRARFEAANTTRDGRLTVEQARAAGMRGVARHFAEIDTDRKGYVTLQDVHVWQKAMHAARMARGQGGLPPASEGPPPPPPSPQ